MYKQFWNNSATFWRNLDRLTERALERLQNPGLIQLLCILGIFVYALLCKKQFCCTLIHRIYTRTWLISIHLSANYSSTFARIHASILAASFKFSWKMGIKCQSPFMPILFHCNFNNVLKILYIQISVHNGLNIPGEIVFRKM